MARRLDAFAPCSARLRSLVHAVTNSYNRSWFFAPKLRDPPHYLQRTTNPAMRQALLTAVARLLDLALDVSPLDAAVQAFRTRCDQAVAQDAATQAYVHSLGNFIFCV
jgi:hypothetical protein